MDKSDNSSLYSIIKQSIGESVIDCYQCGKCSAGCPLTGEMDYPPSQLLRMIQHAIPELDEKVLRSYTIWLCLNCETCIARCPQEVDLPAIMDFLRAESMRSAMVNPKAKDILSFHKSFLDTIRFTGRLYEIGLIAAYKIRSRHFLQDILLAPRLFLLGKLKLFPHTIKNRKGISQIFSKLTGKKHEEVHS